MKYLKLYLTVIVLGLFILTNGIAENKDFKAIVQPEVSPDNTKILFHLIRNSTIHAFLGTGMKIGIYDLKTGKVNFLPRGYGPHSFMGNWS
ncbi:MAG: hypothetical protein QME64_11680 [bacterium]|nr:hypothetical protein [bacterium]